MVSSQSQRHRLLSQLRSESKKPNQRTNQVRKNPPSALKTEAGSRHWPPDCPRHRDRQDAGSMTLSAWICSPVCKLSRRQHPRVSVTLSALSHTHKRGDLTNSRHVLSSCSRALREARLPMGLLTQVIIVQRFPVFADGGHVGVNIPPLCTDGVLFGKLVLQLLCVFHAASPSVALCHCAP